ncbi:MAG: alpha/beta hydrolase [Phycisphaerae bacterium]
MPFDVTEHSPVPLWDDPAPGALGDGPADVPTLAWYRPAKLAKPAAMLVFPGGGYEHLAEHEGQPVARWLASLGIAAAVVRYRVRPYQLPSALLDARRAMHLVRTRAREWDIDDARVGAVGFSAGGHLVTCISTIDEPCPDPRDQVDRAEARPSVLIACYAPFSLPAMGRPGPHEWLLGENAPPSLTRYVELDRHVEAGFPPAMLWTTGEDRAVPPEQSLLMAGAIRAAGGECQLHLFARGRHGLGLAAGEPAGAWPNAGWPIRGIAESRQSRPGVDCLLAIPQKKTDRNCDPSLRHLCIHPLVLRCGRDLGVVAFHHLPVDVQQDSLGHEVGRGGKITPDRPGVFVQCLTRSGPAAGRTARQ